MKEPNEARILTGPKTLIKDEDGRPLMGWQFKYNGEWKFIIDVDATLALQERADQ